MKKYLFGLGAMLIGAGLMFVFTHTEVSAESEVRKPEPFVCSYDADIRLTMFHCETKTLDCALFTVHRSEKRHLTCFKKGMFK